MTDRLKGCTVVFENDIRTDDAEVLINSIRMLRGVLSVETNVSDTDDWMNRERIKHELTRKLWEVLGR